MNVFAIFNNGKRKKEKYQRIKRPEKLAKIVNYYTEEKAIAKYEKVIEGRKHNPKKRREDDNRFLERVRKQQY
jgi:hypothetical protein